MRVLLASSSSGSRGGGEIFLLYLGEALQTAGHTIAFWASRHPRMDEIAGRFSRIGQVLREDYTNTYDRWHRGLLPSGNGAELRIAKSWRAWKPDIVHLNKQNLEDGLDLLGASAALPVPHLCTVHITQPARFLGAHFAIWRDAGARRALRSYPGPLVAVAPVRARELAEFIGRPADVRTVLNGIAPSAASDEERDVRRKREGFGPDCLSIVAMGRLEPQKGPLRFLRYAKRIRTAFPDAQLRWMGGGRMEAEWDKELASLGLQSAVKRMPWCDDARSALAAYDLFLHTAAYEGLSLAILEAMDAGLPCAIEREVHAQLPAPLRDCSLSVNDATDWASLLHDKVRLADIGRLARETVRAGFSTAIMARAYESIYKELCLKR